MQPLRKKNINRNCWWTDRPTDRRKAICPPSSERGGGGIKKRIFRANYGLWLVILSKNSILTIYIYIYPFRCLISMPLKLMNCVTKLEGICISMLFYTVYFVRISRFLNLINECGWNRSILERADCGELPELLCNVMENRTHRKCHLNGLHPSNILVQHNAHRPTSYTVIRP